MTRGCASRPRTDGRVLAGTKRGPHEDADPLIDEPVCDGEAASRSALRGFFQRSRVTIAVDVPGGLIFDIGGGLNADRRQRIVGAQVLLDRVGHLPRVIVAGQVDLQAQRRCGREG